jgi:hypothetical protein
LRPSPDVWIRYSCALIWPLDDAEKTIQRGAVAAPVEAARTSATTAAASDANRHFVPPFTVPV